MTLHNIFDPCVLTVLRLPPRPTGCSGSGIGYHLAQAFHAHGCRVFVSARNLSKLSPDLDERFDRVTLDVMDESSIQKAVADVESKTSGRIGEWAEGACVGRGRRCD